MKSRTIILSLLALSAAVFTGCREEEPDIDLPGIKVTGAELVFDAETKKASCAVDMDLTTLNFSVAANREWTADINWDDDEIPWIAVTPDHGPASDVAQRVVVTILNNAGYNRNKQVKFSINYDYKTVDFSQKGERGEEIVGTLENPLTVAGAVKYVKSLGSDVQSSSGVYVKGKISRIDDNNNFASSGTYGNATFYISDDGTDSGEQFYCYRVLYLGNKKWTSKDPDIKVGDEVIIYGHVVNYKGNTPETVQGTAFIYEHNGVNRGTDEGGGGGGGSTVDPAGTGTQADPYNVSAALAAVKPLSWTSNDNYESTDEVYVKGKISRIADNGTFGQSGTFGNATFYISDDGTQNGELYCYRILYIGNKKYTSGDDIKVGDDVVICGKLMNYRGNTPETVANAAYLYSLNSQGGGGGQPSGGEAKGTGTLDDPYNPMGAAAAVAGLTWTSNTDYQKTGDVYIKGKISRIADKGTFTEGGTYGNASFYISEDGAQANEFYCFRILYLGNKKFESGQTDIKVGDEVVVCGKLMNYRGNTPETVAGEAYLYSLNNGGSGGGGGGTPSGGGSGTLEDPYTPTGAIAAVAGLTWTSNTDYQKTEKVYLKGKISKIANNGTYVGGGTYGNASYYISADGTESGDQFYIFRSLYFNGEKYTEGTDIQVGDEVVVYGALMNYKGNTPETVAGENWLYSLNGNTGSGGGGGGGTSTGGDGSVNNPYNVAEAIAAVAGLTWTSNTDYQKTDKVYLKGKISKIANNGTYVGGGTYGNASYYISADGTESGDQFYIFRSLYFNGEKYTSGTDIQVGDEVVVYGALMNYKGNTPETVAGENWLYMLNGKTDGSGSGGGGGGGTSTGGDGSVNNPYNVAEAIAAVAGLTWTSNTDYQKTEKVYLKGKISKIANNGTYVGGGTYGNASYYISADGTESGDQFYIFRSLYFNGEKYTSGTDIQVGDDVVVYGALMNYKGNTPETVANENWLYMLNGKTDGSASGGGSGSGGGDPSTASTLSFGTTSADGTWAPETDATYGAGFSATIQGVTVGYYKHTGSQALNAPSASEARIYKNGALSVTAPAGKTFKKIVVKCPSTGSGQYCVDMTGLEGGGNGTADKTALTVTWTGSASKVVLHTNNGQVRMTGLEIEFE